MNLKTLKLLVVIYWKTSRYLEKPMSSKTSFIMPESFSHATASTKVNLFFQQFIIEMYVGT